MPLSDLTITQIDEPLNTFASLLDQLQSTSSKNEKRDIIAAALDGHEHSDETHKLLTYALSPYITFGIKQLPEPGSVSPRPMEGRQRYEFAIRILEQLRTRQLTGNQAQDVVRMFFELLSANPAELDAFKRVLSRDLRCDISESTVNKAKKGAIPVFSCQLAHSEMPAVDAIPYPVAIEPKYDGVRTIAIKKDGVVTLFSRSGKEFTNFAEIDQFLTLHMTDNTVLDGEVMHAELLGDKGFQAVMKRARAERGKNVEGNPVKYMMFDSMPLGAWENQDCTMPYINRRKGLELYAPQLTVPLCSPVELAPVTYANEADELQEQYRAWVDAGFEGLIVKSLDGGYTFKRNKTWMKLKPMATADLKVVDMVEGTGKAAGMLGALVLEGEHEGVPVHTKCGSGFTQAQREEMWRDRTSILDRVAEISYQDMTQEQSGNTWSLRFPIFQRFRDVAGNKV